MGRLRTSIAAAALLLALPGVVLAASAVPLQSANVDVGNQASLQRGAKYFVNYCLGCHSAQYVRYNRLAEDLGLSEDAVIDNLMFTGEQPHDTMSIAMPGDDSSRWFGKTPPDLSLIARARGNDYVYTFLKSFYADESKATGANNKVLVGTAMPHVLWELQGIQRAVYNKTVHEDGTVHEEFDGFVLDQPGSMTPEEYDAAIRDITTFLAYIAEPVQLERRSLGIKVMIFLLVFFVLSLGLKKEIWKSVK